MQRNRLNRRDRPGKMSAQRDCRQEAGHIRLVRSAARSASGTMRLPLALRVVLDSP